MMASVVAVYDTVWLKLFVAWHMYVPLSFLCSELICSTDITPTSLVNVVLSCSRYPGDTLVADWVVMVMVESAATGRPSFHHEMVGSG